MDYIRIYEKIIDRANSQNRKKNKEGQIYENHHIIPILNMVKILFKKFQF